MRVAIIGAGSIGLLFASYLSEKGMECHLYTRRRQQAQVIQDKGIVLKTGEQMRCFYPSAKPFTDFSGHEELIIVTVKQYDLPDVCARLMHIPTQRTILFVQNGMGHIDHLEQLRIHPILLGVVEHGALRLSENVIAHTGVGKTKLAAWHAKQALLVEITQMLNSGQFQVDLEADWQNMLMNKLVINAVINPLTALYKVKNGELLTRSFVKTMEIVFEEICEALQLHERQIIWQEVIRVCQTTSENESSMLKDIMNKRETELDAILGYVLKKGEKTCAKLPVTHFLYHSIKGMEQGGD